MLAALVPVVRREGDKNAESDQRNFGEEVEKGPWMFSAAQAFARECARASGRFKFPGMQVV